MFNLIGLPLEEAKRVLNKNDLSFSIVEYSSRFKDNVQTDSLRVVGQRELADGCIELVISDFKTTSQS